MVKVRSKGNTRPTVPKTTSDDDENTNKKTHDTEKGTDENRPKFVKLILHGGIRKDTHTERTPYVEEPRHPNIKDSLNLYKTGSKESEKDRKGKKGSRTSGRHNTHNLTNYNRKYRDSEIRQINKKVG